MSESNAKTLTVILADAPRDVLVFLVDHGPASTGEIVAAVAPADAVTPDSTVRNACSLLVTAQWAGLTDNGWHATEAGHAAVLGARLAAVSSSSAGTP